LEASETTGTPDLSSGTPVVGIDAFADARTRDPGPPERASEPDPDSFLSALRRTAATEISVP